jgi:hypothetical protein
LVLPLLVVRLGERAPAAEVIARLGPQAPGV